MANFPATIFPDYKVSSEDWRDPMLKDYARSGAFRGRRLQTAKKRRINLVFKLLTNADRGTLETHYDANRDLTFVFVWPDSGLGYTVAYANDNAISFQRSAPNRWDATVILEEI